MQYNLTVNDETVSVETESTGDGTFTATLADKTWDVAYKPVSDHRIHLSINGRSYNAYVVDREDGKEILINGKSYQVGDADALSQTRPKKKGPDGPKEVTPNTPATVISVPVQAGDSVEKGQAVVVVSAMKMETTLTAPYDGTVTKVNVAEGDSVMPGNILVEIDANAPPEQQEAVL